jgi:DNA-binding transcriptional LysR family regulator
MLIWHYLCVARITEMSGSTGVELRHLRAFVAVAEERSFTRAAARLQLTQPALSRTVAALERLVGLELVQRNTRSVRLTPAGTRLLPYAHRALVVVEEAVGAAVDRPAVLRVGFTWGSTAEYTGPIVRAFEQDHPGVSVEIRRYDDTVAGLADGRTHVGFLPGPPEDPRLGTLVLAEEPRVVALPADHPLAARDAVRLHELRTETIVINVVSGTTSLELWEAPGRPAATVRVRNVDEWMEAIAAGRGIGTTPASTGRLYTHPSIRYVRIEDAPDVPIILAWLRTAQHPLVADFVAVAGRTRPRRRPA